MEKLLIGVCFLTVISIASALECYTCVNQDSNHDKCTKTTKQCEQYQDTCLTYVSWKVPPYWTPRGERIHYITKDCDTRMSCSRQKTAMAYSCKRDWYNDWACVECCQGDLCNYYVTMGASSIKAGVTSIVAGSLLVLLMKVL